MLVVTTYKASNSTKVATQPKLRHYKASLPKPDAGADEGVVNILTAKS